MYCSQFVVFIIISSIYFVIRTWLTEPGICLKSDEEEEPPPEASENQRKVSSLMACVRNDKMELITVILHISSLLIRKRYLKCHI